MIRALRQLAQLAARHTADDEAIRPRRAVGRVAVLPRFLRAEEVGPVRPAALIDGLAGVWVVFVLRGADAAGGNLLHYIEVLNAFCVEVFDKAARF